MYNYKMTIQYDGGRYKGWQRLGNSESTIQEKLEHVLSELAGYELEIIGCSRTDAGVHALAQTANFKLKEFLPKDQIMEYLSRYLPQDISVIQIVTVSESFHARYHAKDKSYLYKIWNRQYSNPFLRKYSMHVKEKLDIARMEEAAGYFIGAHDFTAFSNAKSRKKTMIREIYSINFEEQDGLINIRLRGDSFLYNMARWIVGTLIDAGLGRLKPADIPVLLEAKERGQAGNLADACGLYLEKISY